MLLIVRKIGQIVPIFFEPSSNFKFFLYLDEWSYMEG